jgi:hypothetical protein
MSQNIRPSSRLPDRRPGPGSRVERPFRRTDKHGIPIAEKAVQFTPTRGFPHRRDLRLVAGGGVLGVVLAAAVVCTAGFGRPIPQPAAAISMVTAPVSEPIPERPVFETSAPEPKASVLQGVRIAATNLIPTIGSESKHIVPASAIAMSSPRDARGVAKRNGRFAVTSAAAWANVKNEAKPPRTVAKRVAPPPAAKDPPAWLWKLTRTPEAELVRKVSEVSLHTISTKTELARDFKQTLGLHTRGSDEFIGALCRERSDLAGLPFLKGDECRLTQQQEQSLSNTSSQVRRALDALHQRAGDRSILNRLPGGPTSIDVKIAFDEFLPTAITNSRNSQSSPGESLPATMQILGPLSGIYRVELASRLEYASDDKAIAANLVRLVLFDPDGEVRAAAVKALSLQPAESYGAKLIEGLRHPFSPIAEHAADALVALNCVEQMPSVVDFLDEPDPSAPFYRDEGRVKQSAIREVVKVNHLRNCLLCHAPVSQDGSRQSGLMALVPSPDEPLPPTTLAYYNNFGPTDMVVRVNEVYLRQDFSRLERVERSGKWPIYQRFDYLVRTRNVTADEAGQKNPKSADGTPSPHQRAALSVLSRLTATYLGTKASDWRNEIARFVEETKVAAH